MRSVVLLNHFGRPGRKAAAVGLNFGAETEEKGERSTANFRQGAGLSHSRLSSGSGRSIPASDRLLMADHCLMAIGSTRPRCRHSVSGSTNESSHPTCRCSATQPRPRNLALLASVNNLNVAINVAASARMPACVHPTANSSSPGLYGPLSQLAMATKRLRTSCGQR